jgi:hypothetical protein
VRRRLATLLALVVLAPLGVVAPADAASSPPAPPWCGTPEPDVAGAKGNIPYYAIKCTLDQIQAESNGRIKTRVIGHSTLGRPMYAVTVDARNTAKQRRNSDRYWQIEDMEIRDPARAQKLLRSFGGEVKVPVFYQANIHGNETESTDASIQFLREVATTPYGEDPAIDKVLDYGLFVFNITQNPDGRVLGQRGNANKIDMNRDYLTQSQPEVRASVAAMRDLHPVLTVDQHGYYNPTEVDGETLPHNPGLEYDLIMPFNEGRVQAQKAALAAAGYPSQIPRSDWCPDGDFPDENDICSDGSTQSPKTAQGFDDYGPFYTAVYGNLTGLDGTTPEMCGSNSSPTSGCATLPDAPAGTPTGRLGSVLNAYTNIKSSSAYVLANRAAMFDAKLESFRRGAAGEQRRPCCEEPFGPEHNWTTPYPRAYVIPVGDGQRSEAEADRLVSYLLFNEIEVSRLKRSTSVGGTRYEKGSYVVSMRQPLRGLADTMLSLGLDLSGKIGQLYAPPAAWSRSALWGATVETIPASASFSPSTSRIYNAPRPSGGVQSGKADVYSLEVDSPSAVRTVNRLLAAGVDGELTLEPGGSLPAGSVLFPRSAKSKLDSVGDDYGVWFQPQDRPRNLATRALTHVPRVAQVMSFGNQNSNSSTGGPLWALRNLGFAADQVYSDATRELSNPAAPNPLANYDLVYVSSGTWPATPTAQQRLREFFASGGGYVGSGSAGTTFIGQTGAGQFDGAALVAGLGGGGKSGIFNWENTGGAASVITGGYPTRDTLMMDPITWFTAVPATASVDARLTNDYFVSGLFPEPRPAGAAGAPVILHGSSTAAGGTAKVTLFAADPLYRGDPEREWPAFSGAVFWAGK